MNLGYINYTGAPLSDDEDWPDHETFRVMKVGAFVQAYAAGGVTDDGRDEAGRRIRLDLGLGGPVPLALDWLASLPPAQRPQRP